mmetsp:Transcript_28682/g.58632  ORF Transcript_28682/g.58632 Transcript_28682/m.58632 type:complete len:290 (+) Transcript_28682:699-1568(+)
MDLWGTGCVFFEITSLYPLFPGTNELDQINRIHKVLGTPGPQLLEKFKRNGAAHVNFDFPEQKGIGVPQLIPHATPDCTDLMVKMLAYDGAERMSAREGLQHPYFREIRELEARRQQQAQASTGGQPMTSTVGPGGQVNSGKGREGEDAPPPKASSGGLPNIGAVGTNTAENSSIAKKMVGGGVGGVHKNTTGKANERGGNEEEGTNLPPIAQNGTNGKPLGQAYNSPSKAYKQSGGGGNGGMLQGGSLSSVKKKKKKGQGGASDGGDGGVNYNLGGAGGNKNQSGRRR